MRAPRSTYLLDNAGAEAQARLGALAEMFDASTERHLLARGVGPGWHCLEVGGGNGSIAEWLADRAMPNGRVVVTDLDRRFLDRLAHPNLETRAHDVTRDPLPEATFDLIHVRLVLVHLREWERVLQRLVAALTPGGWLVAEEFDSESVPPDPDRSPGEVVFKTQIATARLMVDHHFDRRFGRLLFGRFRDAGLIEAGVYGAPPRDLSSQPEISRESSPHQRVRKIATEEAFCTPDVAAAVRDVVRRGGANLDLPLLTLIYNAPNSAESKPPDAGGSGASNRDQQALQLLPRLLDVGAMRLAEMDAHGVDMHILSLTMPGVQLFDRDTAVALARSSNDQLAEAVRRHPTRFAGLASFSPQDPAAAAREMERAVKELRLNGFIVNSHTGNAYLDEQRFWPIFEAAEALGAPLYLHPRAPSDGMAAPFRDYRIEGAVWGYGVEAATHVIRLIFGGVFDRFPRLRLVIGHMGEALPFWLSRLDFMGAPGARGAVRKNALKPSEYFRRNIAITTSGVEDPLALRFCIDKIGIENIMWAIDHPFQPTAPAVAFLETAPMTDVEREHVAHRNAERIFRIST